MKGGEIPPDLPAQAFTGLAMIWQERLDAYLTLLEARGLRERLLAQLPKAGRFDWSATFTGGIFHPVTRCLSTWNCGNAGGLVAAAEPQIIAPTDRYITFQVSLVPEEPLRACLTLSPLTDLAPEHFTNVAGFALVSDGMERYRLEGLLTRLAGIPFAALGDFRLALLKGADLTWDDKSLVFGRFL